MEVKKIKLVGAQSKRLSNKLITLKQDVTKTDRKSACEELSLSYPVITKYLNGTVEDNDTAVKLIAFFSKKIAKREEYTNL